MKNKIIRYVAILLSFASIITLFAACSKEKQVNDYILEKDGKIFYRKDVNDDYYELVTDKDGVTVVDEQGNMLWKVTDANGEEQTHPVSFPTFMNDGKTVSCQQLSITCPKGWESTGNQNFIIKNSEKDMHIFYSFLGKDEETYLTVEENIAKLEESFKPMVDEGTAVLTKSTTQVAGRDATKLIIEVKTEPSSYQEVYYVETNTGTMNFLCTCNLADKGFDFKAILDTVEYRV